MSSGEAQGRRVVDVPPLEEIDKALAENAKERKRLTRLRQWAIEDEGHEAKIPPPQRLEADPKVEVKTIAVEDQTRKADVAGPNRREPRELKG